MKKRYCLDCGKIITRQAKRCRSCAKKGKFNGLYKHGEFSHRRFCKNCNKEIKGHMKGIIYCKKCAINKFYKAHLNSHKGKKNPMYGRHRYGKKNPNYGNHKLNANTLEKHHLDLNRANNKKSNILTISLKIHRKLHLYAYRYIVKKRMLKKYLKWFFKYGINTPKYKK
jgi:hypothetical protein